MEFKNHKFANHLDADFAKTLRSRVNGYFKENNLNRHANAQMVTKTVIVFALYLVPYFLMMFGVVTGTAAMFGMWAIMGLGLVGIGTGVMHDSVHGSYSKNPKVNKVMSLSMNIIGSSAKLWHFKHNVLHHTYTNIDHADDDINPRGFFRFSPHQKRKFFHNFQHVYALLFYCLLTFTWIIGNDFKKIKIYRDRNLIKTDKEMRQTYASTLAWKLYYISAMIVLPMIVFQQPWWLTFLMFFSMHVVAGFLLSVIFQLAHVVPDAHFPAPSEDGSIEHNWFVHQLLTTSNYAPTNKALTWMVGGLNMQVEHHLFPNICHVHYHKIAPIVKQTAEEFGIPYYVQPSMLKALGAHLRWLRMLGQAKYEPEEQKTLAAA